MIYFFGGEECDIEIPGGKTKCPAIVFAQDVDIGCVTVLLHCATNSTEAMIVGRDRHWPVARDGIVVGHQTTRRARRREWVVSLVDNVINTHEASASTASELPYPGSADV